MSIVISSLTGITKFKLLRPKTRGILEDEILITEILRNLNYIAPRTIKVQTRVNEATTEMIFQEKAAKEMLEFNKRKDELLPFYSHHGLLVDFELRNGYDDFPNLKE